MSVLETGSSSAKVNISCSCIQQWHNFIFYSMCKALSLSTVLNSICDEKANVYDVVEMLKFFIPFLWTKSLSSLLLHKGDLLWFSQNCLTHGVVSDDWTKIRQNHFLRGVVHTYKHLQTANWQTPISGINTIGPLRLSCKRDIYSVVSNWKCCIK